MLYSKVYTAYIVCKYCTYILKFYYTYLIIMVIDSRVVVRHLSSSYILHYNNVYWFIIKLLETQFYSVLTKKYIEITVYI